MGWGRKIFNIILVYFPNRSLRQMIQRLKMRQSFRVLRIRRIILVLTHIKRIHFLIILLHLRSLQPVFRLPHIPSALVPHLNKPFIIIWSEFISICRIRCIILKVNFWVFCWFVLKRLNMFLRFFPNLSFSSSTSLLVRLYSELIFVTSLSQSSRLDPISKPIRLVRGLSMIFLIFILPIRSPFKLNISIFLFSLNQLLRLSKS